MKLPRYIDIAAFSVLLFSTPPLIAQADYSTLQTPRKIQYQGRVATGTGAAWNGTEGYFAFALVQGATVLWNNWEGTVSPSDPGTTVIGPGQFLTLPVSGGVFSVRLGEGSDTNEQVPATVFFDTTANTVRTEVRLAVWFSPNGDTFTRLSPDVDFTSVPYAMVSGIAETVKERAVTQNMLAPSAGVPVGAVVAWWGLKSAIPADFELCDGTNSTTPGAVVTVKPDLRGRFPRGAENARTDVVSTPLNGGSDTIASSDSGGTAISEAQMPSHGHSHTLVTSSAGAHSHTTSGGYSTTQSTTPSGSTRYVISSGSISFQTPSITIASAGAHTHTINGSITAAGGGQAHTHTIPPHDNRPAYLELFYIIRVK